MYVLHTARSWAQLRASQADRPQSEQIWCSQVMGRRTAPWSVPVWEGWNSVSDVGLLWLVHYLAYVQRGRTVRGGADEQSTGYSADPIWCRPWHS